MADTPWGELRVSDAHVHYFSHRFFSALAKQKHAENAEAIGPLLHWEIPAEGTLAERWRQELDSHGIARACLIASVPAAEDDVANAVHAHPDRFYGCFMLDPTQPDAVDRINRSTDMQCVALFPAMHRYSIADPTFSPVLEAAAAKKLAVFVHCGALTVGFRKKLGLPSLFDMRFSNPLHVHTVALRFPHTPFILPHFGAGMLREALMLADLCPNVFLDTSSSNSWMRYEGLDLRTVFHRALDVLGTERLLFGTDSSYFPRGWHKSILEEQTTALYELGLKEAEARRILSGNLEHLYGNHGLIAPATHSK